VKITFVISLILIAAGIVLWVQDINAPVTILLLIVGLFGALLVMFRRSGGSETYIDGGSGSDGGSGE
jgi:hypothetical protein